MRASAVLESYFMTLNFVFLTHGYCDCPFVCLFFQEGKQELYENTHPDPYCVAYMPGGTLFMRNPPLPMEVCFPDGNIPSDAPKITFNSDMTVSKEETGKNFVGSVLVDFTKKNME